jgi:hypothetical protein
MYSEKLPRLRSTDGNPSEATLPAQLIGFPTMSMDDDVLYLMFIAYHTGQDVVISVDTRKNTLKGFANLVAGKDFIFTRNCTSEISKYLSKGEGNFSILVSAPCLCAYHVFLANLVSVFCWAA